MSNAKTAILKVIDVIYAMVGGFLGLRVLLELAAANSGAPVVLFIYTIANRFMMPFRGIFPNYFLGGGVVFDTTAMTALVFYSLAYYLVRQIAANFELETEGGLHHAHHEVRHI